MTKLLFLSQIVFWFLFPLGQFGKFSIDFILGSIALLTLVAFLKNNKPIAGRVLFPWLILIGWLGISLIVNPLNLSSSQLLKPALYLFRFIFGSALLFTGIYLSDYRNNLYKLMVIGSFGLAASGLAQYIFFPYLGPLTALGWDPHLYRLVGSHLDPGFTGLALVLGFILIGLTKKSLGLEKKLWALLSALFYVSIALTYSRATYLALIAGLGVIALKTKAFTWFGKFLLLFFITIILLPRPAGEGVRLERENSLLARLENWSHTAAIFSKYPLTGVGFNAFGFAQEKEGYLILSPNNHSAFGSDSSWLLVLATSGIIGAILFGFFLERVISPSPLIIASSVAIFFHAWFINSFFYPWILSWIALLFGLALSPKAQTKQKAA